MAFIFLITETDRQDSSPLLTHFILNCVFCFSILCTCGGQCMILSTYFKKKETWARVLLLGGQYSNTKLMR